MTSTETLSLSAARTGTARTSTYGAGSAPVTIGEARPARVTPAMVSRIRSLMITTFYAAGPVAFVVIETAGFRNP
jgi:hypothetical protein